MVITVVWVVKMELRWLRRVRHQWAGKLESSEGCSFSISSSLNDQSQGKCTLMNLGRMSKRRGEAVLGDEAAASLLIAFALCDAWCTNGLVSSAVPSQGRYFRSDESYIVYYDIGIL